VVRAGGVSTGGLGSGLQVAVALSETVSSFVYVTGTIYPQDIATPQEEMRAGSGKKCLL